MVACAFAAAAHAQPKFDVRDGDRFVFLGGGLFERDLRYGYIETFLTARFHDLNLTFRNLAWAGDTVFGSARAGFDTAAQGYERMIKAVNDAKPSVVFLYMGQNEAFDGKSGLKRFNEGLTRLLSDLDATGARIVIISPTLLENLGPPLPDPAEQNEKMKLYAAVLKEVATENNYYFADLTRPLHYGANQPIAPLTGNGLHFTNYGYWKLAQELLVSLGYVVPLIDAQGEQPFELNDEVFFMPRMPHGAPETAQAKEIFQTLQFGGLPEGKYTLTSDSGDVKTTTAAEWAEGIRLEDIPEVRQVEELRKTIIEKNRLFFNQWRPQNETYIFGFRKYEQGRFAEETPQFDPLIAEFEKRIAELRVPKQHTYRFVQQ